MSAPHAHHSTRSKSCGRQPERELHLAGTHTAATAPARRQGRPERSPTRTPRLPDKEVNKAGKQRKGPSNDQVSPAQGGKQPLKNFNNNSDEAVIIDNNSTSPHNPGSIMPPVGVSDNRGNVEDQQDIATIPLDGALEKIRLAKEDPSSALLLVLAELREIKSQMVTLNKVENTTATLVEQLAATISKTNNLETKVDDTITKTNEIETKVNNFSNKMEKIEENFSSLDAMLKQHGSQINSLQSLEKNISESTDKTIECMNGLIDTQRQQVDSFNEGAKQLQEKWAQQVLVEVDKRVQVEVNKRFKIKENNEYCQSLKDQAYQTRHNLVVVGLTENQERTAFQTVQDFFKNSLKLNNLSIYSALRLGTSPDSQSDYARPILVTFNSLSHRNKVWRKRSNIPNEDPTQQIRIQADLPKTLKDGVQALYKVANAAWKIDEFKSATVRNFQLELNGKTYQITDLESVPERIRPSTLSSLRSDTHLVFFSKHTVFSNHFPSNFTIQGQSFATMEQFLALKRAEISGKEELIKRARGARDPVQAKRILTTLHSDHQEEWDNQVEELALEGLQAKFSQNTQCCSQLCATRNLVLGEASPNARWGIGMHLSDPDVMDSSKWLENGNLLGRSLMKLREELIVKDDRSTS